MAKFLFPIPQWFLSSGVVNAGGLIYTYAAGTVTPLSTWSESTGSSLNTNPVVLDSAGRAQIWLSAAAYKFIVQTSAGAAIMTIDGYNPDTLNTTVTALASTGDVTLQQGTAATSGANQSSNNIKIQATYWDGAASQIDQWNIADVLGTGANPTSTLTITHSGSSGAATLNIPNVNATLGNVSLSSAGAFGNTQNNRNSTEKINSINLDTEATALFGASQFVSEALSSGIQIPNTATAPAFGSAVSGYANTSSTTTPSVGIFGGSRALANSTKAFGGNLIAQDVAGLTTGVVLSGLEVDTVPTNTNTAYSAANGVSSILGTGSHAGTFSDAFNASTNKSTAQWTNAFHANPGCALQALLADKLVASGATASQPVVFVGDSGGGSVTASISCDNAGNLTTTLPAAGFFQATRFRASEETTAFPSIHDASSTNTGVNFRGGVVEIVKAGVASLQAFGAGIVVDTEIRFPGGSVDVTSPDVGIARISSGVLGISTSGINSSGALQLAQLTELSANGAQWICGQASELLTLSTSGSTTDTSANLLPANSIIEAVVARVTTTITVATDWKLGDPTTTGRFTAADSTMTAGETQVGILHWSGAVTTLAAGPSQAAAAKVRVTTTGTPGAGVMRITVFYRQFVAPTS